MRWHTIWSFILLMLFSGATYLTYLVSRAGGLNPIDHLELMQQDIANLGPAAFLLDFIVLYLIIRWIRKPKNKTVPALPRPDVPSMIELPPPPPSQTSADVWSDLAMLRDYGDENL